MGVRQYVPIIVVALLIACTPTQVVPGDGIDETATRPAVHEQPSLSFLVAGHAYGDPQGGNLGIYPKLLDQLMSLSRGDVEVEFLIFVGDTVRSPSKEAWEQVVSELDQVGLPYYLVMGNHDVSAAGRQTFADKYGGSFYGFQRAGVCFLVLDSQPDWGRITPEQINFLRQEVERADCGIFFVFFHELLWASGRIEFQDVRHNKGSYEELFSSNFWDEVYPILEGQPEKRFYVVAGDVGALRNAIPAYYMEYGNVSLIATGMGLAPEENYMLVQVIGDHVELILFPLNQPGHQLDIREYETNLRLADYSLGRIVLLTGYRFSRGVRAGEDLEVTLYWRAARQPEHDYTVFVHVLDSAGQIVAQTDGMPEPVTSEWKAGESIQSKHVVKLPADLTEGSYSLTIGLYLWQSLERLPVQDEDGRQVPGAVIGLEPSVLVLRQENED